MNIEDLELGELQQDSVIKNVKFWQSKFVEPGKTEEAFLEEVHFEFVGEKLTATWDARAAGRRGHFAKMISGREHFVGKTMTQLREESARRAIRAHFEAASSHRKLQIVAALSQVVKKNAQAI